MSGLLASRLVFMPETPKIIALTERQSTRVVLSENMLRELLPFCPKIIQIEPLLGEVETYRLTPRGQIGELRLSTCRVVIQPKIPLLNLLFLLGIEPETNVTTERTPFSIEIVLEALLDRWIKAFRVVIQNGLRVGYQTIESVEPFLRGRLRMSDQLRDFSAIAPQFHCAYDTLSTDHLLNQIPYSLLDLLLRSALSSETKASLGWLQAHCQGISVIPLTEEMFSIRFVEASPHYALLMGLSQQLWWYFQRIPVFSSQELPTLLSLESIFEDYLFRELRFRLKAFTGLEIFSQVRQRIADNTSQRPLLFQIDLWIESKGKLQSLCDVKWKRLQKTPTASDLHQILSYAQITGCRDVRLIYPGRKYTSVSYNIPSTSTKLIIHTVAVQGSIAKCRNSLDRLAASLNRSN